MPKGPRKRGWNYKLTKLRAVKQTRRGGERKKMLVKEHGPAIWKQITQEEWKQKEDRAGANSAFAESVSEGHIRDVFKSVDELLAYKNDDQPSIQVLRQRSGY